jgi:hypothetical protein
MPVIALGLIVGVFVTTFLLAGRMVKSVPLQLFLGFMLGVGLCVALGMTALGVAFAGCLFYGASGGFH